MGFLRSLFGGSSPDPAFADAINSAIQLAPQFAIDADSIDPAVFGLTSYASPTSPAPRISRREAIQVPAVKRSRDLIAGVLGTLPIDLFGPQKNPSPSPLFDQPERDVPRSVTMARLYEDLLFESVAWWRIVEVGWHGYPVKVRRLDPRTVTVNNDARPCGAVNCEGKVSVDGRHVHDAELIRFDSPNDGLLIAGARAIRTCLQLDAAAARNSDGAPPIDYFTPAEGADPADDTEIIVMLDAWRTARQSRSTGYVPAALKYNSGGWNAEQMQMAEQRQHAVLEIARCAGIDAEELGVSTTSRTYSNQFDRRKAYVDFCLGGYRQAVEDRLSMGDVTPGGYAAKVNLSAFLRSDDKTRYEAYALGLAVGAIDQPEIRDLEDKPALAAPASPAPEAPMPVPVAASQFADPSVEVVLDAVTDSTFSVDLEKRTIRGLAVPYGVAAMSKGKLFQFSRGTLKYGDVTRIKLLIGHDFSQAIGYVSALEDTDEGLVPTFKIARGDEGDKALSLAEDKVLDGLSIGLGNGSRFSTKDGVFHAIEAPLAEISLTPSPAFADARVLSVAASADQGDLVMDDDTKVIETAEVAPDFSAISDAITKGFEGLGPVPGRQIIPAGGAGFQVTEPSPYRFDGLAGSHSFSEDLRSYGSDSEARGRLEQFMEDAFEQFAVTTGDTSTLSPTQNRPDLFVPNLTFTRPLWNLVTTGGLSDRTPFTIPKFAAAAGLVAAHVQGTEPTPGSFSATSQTISPGAVSGKVEINREVWDQPGPQSDQIIWGEMLNGYFEALEAKIAAMLNGLTLTEINLASAVDEALIDAVQNIFVDLQYVRGGNRYSALALDGLLFKALINASDTSGRKLLPVVAPSNAQGSTSGGFSVVAIGSQTGAAAWALGATNASHSYLFVPSSVFCWASAPKKFVFEYQVKSIDMAVWGYTASAVLRDTDVKRIDYTTADV